MEIGCYNTFDIVQLTPSVITIAYRKNLHTYSLSRLPKNVIGKKVGDKVSLFVYTNKEGVCVPTFKKPFALCNDFAYLEVVDVNKYGAFLEWGIEKNLFIPFREQRMPMKIGDWHTVYIYKDDKTERLVGSSRLNRFLFSVDRSRLDIQKGQEVKLYILNKTDIGVQVIVDKKYRGLLYSNEIFKPLEEGDVLNGYVKKIRLDKKIDVSLQPQGYTHVEQQAAYILTRLREHKGRLNFSDKSSPEAIKNTFKMSKKTFKKALGHLYKKQIICIKEDRIEWCREELDNEKVL